MQQFHWFNLFHQKDVTNWDVTNPKAVGFPSLNPWILVDASSDKTTFDRNPYYFKVDPAGNQLPYIDQIESTLVQDMEMITMKIIAGEVDFTRESTALVNIPLYKENEANGGYDTILLMTHGRPGNLYINQTYDDPIWREYVQDKRFREALNLGINRTEVIDAIYYGLAEEPQLFNSGEYNPERANELLDEIGLDQRDAEGWRLGSDGNRFEIHLEISARVPENVPQTELIVEYWNDLGLRTTMRTIDNALWGTRNAANELQVTIDRMPEYWWLSDFKEGVWAPLWRSWYNSNGQSGEEPPEEVKAFYEQATLTKSSPPEQGIAAYEEIQRMNSEHLFYINVVEEAFQPLIVSSRLGNIPHGGTTIAANFAGEEFFFKEE